MKGEREREERSWNTRNSYADCEYLYKTKQHTHSHTTPQREGLCQSAAFSDTKKRFKTRGSNIAAWEPIPRYHPPRCTKQSTHHHLFIFYMFTRRHCCHCSRLNGGTIIQTVNYQMIQINIFQKERGSIQRAEWFSFRNWTRTLFPGAHHPVLRRT